MWPVAPLVELTASFARVELPKTVLMAWVSQMLASCGVEVPCALDVGDIRRIQAGVAEGHFHAAGRVPLGLRGGGEVMKWLASAVFP